MRMSKKDENDPKTVEEEAKENDEAELEVEEEEVEEKFRLRRK